MRTPTGDWVCVCPYTGDVGTVRGREDIPALIADNQDWVNILQYGLGIQPKRPKFVPKSAAAGDLVLRAEELVPDFQERHANFCISHFARRNVELHTGNMSFSNIGSSTWLPTFYSVCSVLLVAQGETLESLFGSALAAQAFEDIAALRDETAKSVKGTIHAHKTVWEQKTDDERATAIAQAETTSLRHYGHRTPCPACGEYGSFARKGSWHHEGPCKRRWHF